ncbi:FAD:protein FMN transferase [Candidatus Omnitrophota bacterium]
MGTFSEISCSSPDRAKASEAMDEAFREMVRIESLFSKHDKLSEVSKINRIAGREEVRLSSETFNIIERSIYYSRISDGSFDITVEPLKKGRYKDVVLNKDRSSIRFLAEDIKVDLGGIVKGYAVDRAKEILSSHGIENALVDIGGNIFALGSTSGKKDWRIGIRDPGDENNMIYKLDLKNKAVSTSGDYERPSHIVDPLNGQPVTKEILSVTVVADSAEKADALSTAIFVMGAERGLRFAKSIKDIEVFIFDKDLSLLTYP